MRQGRWGNGRLSLGWIQTALLVLAALVLLAAGRKLTASESAWPPKTFPIGFWCGPPEPYITAEQYKRIAEAGFTFVLPPCEGEATVERNRKILDTARAAGLKAIISDSRMPLAVTGDPSALPRLKAIVADYKKHPALLGYFITDEPGANQFSGLAEVVAELRKLDPDHLAYINLFPNYASTNLTAQPSQLNTDTYEQYLEKYLQTVRPAVLSWDHYHFLTSGDRPGFFGNLAAAPRAAGATNPITPFWQIVLSVQHGPYRALSENELRFEAMQTLVYGGQGLLYFTYWLPRDDAAFHWSRAIMNRDGTPGPLYEAVKRVNQEVRTLGKWLYGAPALRTFQTGEIPPDGAPPADDVPVKIEAPGNLTVGTFRDSGGYFLVMVTNRDYKQGVSTTLLAYAGAHPIQILDLATNEWRPVTEKKDAEGVTRIPIALGPAGAALIRWY